MESREEFDFEGFKREALAGLSSGKKMSGSNGVLAPLLKHLLESIIYEHAIGNFIITGKTGVKLTPSGRLFRKEENFDDAVFEIKPDPVFYFNVGVSFNPFTFLEKNN